jgi:hypothetical protein
VPLRPVQNLAICTADVADGYDLLFCTPDWEYVIYEFDETLEYARRAPLTEFGLDVAEWHQRAEPGTEADGGGTSAFPEAQPMRPRTQRRL